ncbi:MAG: TonB-dependent receptor [Nitrospiraceae bacterium]
MGLRVLALIRSIPDAIFDVLTRIGALPSPLSGPAAVRGNPGRLVGVLALACWFWGTPAFGANRVPPSPDHLDLVDMSLEELMSLPVTSVSKQTEPYAQTAAALFVLTQEDIRRSGATSIPEALRMVPGVQVAKIDSNKWAISARGFNGRFANKLLVLVDGRTVYSPTFAGVNWDQQDTILEDIERIEVIRGPGATLWGVNAVNGVINIITKKAKDTQGGLFVGGAGTEERGFTGLRYGTSLGDNTHMRIYGKFFARDDQVNALGDPAVDRWHQARTGARMDHKSANGDEWTLQGDYYAGEYRENVNLPTLSAPFIQTNLFKAQTTGGNALARWTHTQSATAGASVQAFFDRVVIKNGRGGVISDTVDLNYQQHTDWGERQNLIWGLGYRFVNNQLINRQDILSISYRTDSRFFSVWSGFFQDEIMLLPTSRSLSLTLGTKLEHNDFTGFVVQPSARLRWTPTDRQTVWGAVSRAIRAPAHSEDDIRINLPTGTQPLATLSGTRSYGNEKLVAFEAGYRNQLLNTLSVDLATFYNKYGDLRSFEPGPTFSESTPSPTHTVLPFTWANKVRAETYGVEASVEWRPTEWWRLQPTYTYLLMRMYTDRSLDPGAANPKGESPQHQASLRSMVSLPHGFEFDAWLRYVDHLPAIRIPSYTTLDLRLGWRPTRQLELSLVGQNLLDSHRPEYRENIISFVPTELQRGVYGKVTWRW